MLSTTCYLLYAASTILSGFSLRSKFAYRNEMAEFRQAKEAVDALEERLAVLTQRQEGDGESVEEKARALRFILVCCMGSSAA